MCSSISPSPAYQGIAWALPVLAEFVESPQPQEQDFYSTAFLCRGCSRKIPWDALYIADSCKLAVCSSITFFKYFFFFSLRKEAQPRRWSEKRSSADLKFFGVALQENMHNREQSGAG